MADQEEVNFIECGSINVSYNIMGIATISYTVITSTFGFDGVETDLIIGDQYFSGVVTNASIQPLPQMTGEDGNKIYYSISVTLIATC